MSGTKQTSQPIRPFVGVNPHRALLSDGTRTEAFARAIEQVVKPGMSVVDLGTGSGVLAMMAARAGATRVVALEVDSSARLAHQVVADNGFADVITVMEADSRHVVVGSDFDVVVSECMGNFFVTDEMQRAIQDAKRFLKPGGTFIPARIQLWLAPCFAPQFDEVAFWARDHYGFDFGAGLDVALNQCYVTRLPGELLAGEAQCWKTLDLVAMQHDLTGRVEMTVDKAVTLHGVCGWFDAELCDDVVLSTHPDAPTTHWAQTLFPFEPFSARAGDVLGFDLVITHDSDYVRRVSWEGDLTRDGNVIQRFTHDTDRRVLPPIR